MANRLAREQSPYLLQHQHNPVDWYPWGDEAFARARHDDKPIFLSVGYSTCHWCHVMAHESFEDAAIAEVLNREFISVKLDREERPDVDRVYMTFIQATTGAGGWPMSVWLTPTLKPFYGGTYFPPTSRWGRPGFADILQEIARAWREERERVAGSADAILARLQALAGGEAAVSVPGTAALETTVAEFSSAFDRRHGGFGGAPKFPRPSELLFLLREHARTGSPDARAMALRTLEAMAAGGVRDHLGGGFHRYAVDAAWRVPHFEKMLYDQAQLTLAYLEAAALTGEGAYADVAIDTLDYVRRDMTDPRGGFYSAEDADSVPPEHVGEPHPHKTEGAFYIWPASEIREALGPDAEVFIRRFGVLPDGNAPSDPQGEFTHKNLLYQAQPVATIAAESGMSEAEVQSALARARQALFARRAARPRPHLDDKILTAWNGLMIGAFARAGRVLENAERYVEVAVRAAEFISDTLWDAGARTLLRRYRQGDAGVEAYAEDYACLIFGLLELFQTTGEPRWLEWAVTLQHTQDRLFWDEAGGGWFSTTGDDRSVLLRLKEDYDGAEPAASSVGAANVMTLAHLTGDDVWARRLDATFGMFAARAAASGRMVPMCMAVLSMYHAGVSEVVIAGERGDEGFESLVGTVSRRYYPSAVLIPVTPASRSRLETLLPWTGALSPREGRATAYVCRNFACQMPAYTPDELAGRLASASAVPR
jgi:uncharacterized protein YyaL (SSP411 family)